MKIYTKTGDDGTTGLFGGRRIPKDALRIEVYGTVDELNAQLGVVRAASPSPDTAALLQRLQDRLFVLGADLATPGDKKSPIERISDTDVLELEAAIDRFDARQAPLLNFILPGGTPAAAALHVARTVCRRAERVLVHARREEALSETALLFLNRLSDLLFVLAREENRHAGVSDTPWTPR